MRNNKKVDKSKLAVNILIPLAGGALFALLSRKGTEAFKLIPKPPLTPPSTVFPIAWSILYVLLGISSYRISQSSSPKRYRALFLYGLDLFFNYAWTIIFFVLESYLFAFIWLIALFVISVAMYIKFAQIDKTAAYLQIPYLLWLVFAAYLNFGVYLLNR